jgi:hypothetical protein
MIVFPNIDDIIKELRGDKINNIIRTDAIPRHIHIFFVDFEYSIISCVVVSCVLVKDDEDIIIYNIILL